MGQGAKLEALRRFVREATECVGAIADEESLLEALRPRLGRLIRDDSWLPESCAQAHPLYYRQYLLHCDPLERFSVVSFVWGPQQRTPIHNHTVWGLVGVLRGAERSQPYAPDAQGWMRPIGAPHLVQAGEIEAVSPRVGDIHQVSNAHSDQVSISIHVYGANIGAVPRQVYLEEREQEGDTGGGHKPRARTFISGYSSASLPNLWDRSGEHPATTGDARSA